MARPATKFAEIASDKQRDELKRLWKCHPHHYTRVRAHAILLSAQHYSVRQVAEIFGVDRDSVASWIDRFQDGGPEALEDEDRPGGPPGLDDQEQQVLRELFEQFPNHPARVQAELERKTGKSVCRETIRRYAKRFGLSWKRFRRDLRKKRDERAFRVAKSELAELLQEPDLDVVYFDEAGFSVKGVVPYGWTPSGQRAPVPVTGNRGSSFQAVGLEHQNGDITTYLHQGTINSSTIINVLDDFSSYLERPTVLILDNASCHTSMAFQQRLKTWSERGLYVYHLPPYSPELNAIERFWKKLKYQLMPPTSWETCKTLLHTLTDRLAHLGEVIYLPSLRSFTQ